MALVEQQVNNMADHLVCFKYHACGQLCLLVCLETWVGSGLQQQRYAAGGKYRFITVAASNFCGACCTAGLLEETGQVFDSTRGDLVGMGACVQQNLCNQSNGQLIVFAWSQSSWV